MPPKKNMIRSSTNAGKMASARRHVFLFKPRFAPLVQAGRKLTTIRPSRTRVVRVGDLLDLRTWSGLPYRSKQVALRVARCVDTGPVTLEQGDEKLSIALKSRRLSAAAIERFAQGEGFESSEEMLAWFDAVHGLPFTGVFYEWAARDNDEE